MKKLFILMALCIGLSLHMFAQASALQNCYSGGTTSIAPHVSTIPGLAPSDTFLPCAIQGVPVTDTIYFTNYTTVNAPPLGTVTMNHLTIDSLYLPSGLCWQTNKTNNTFNGGESGVIYISGTTNAAAGQYKLRIIVSVLVNGFITQNNLNAESSTGLAYRVRLINSTCTCPYIDNSSADSALVYIPFPAHCPPTAIITSSGNDTICPTGAVTLTATTGTAYAYKWSNAAHSTTRAITATAAGSYQVTVYNSYGDSTVSAPTVVVQGTFPSSTLTLHGNASICPGTIDTISAPAGYSYHWTANAGNATTQSVSVTNAGSYVVTITNSYGCQAFSSPEVITNSGSCGAPVAIITPAGHDTICPGDSVTLTATSGTGYSFKWSNAAHSTTQSITVSAGGAYTVTVYHAPDSAISAATTIVIASVPSTVVTLTGSSSFCPGDSTTLSAAAGLTYSWSNQSHAQSIVTTAAGSFTVTVTNSNGCSAVSTPHVITVYTAPVDTITRAGLVLTSQTESTYQWYQGTTLLTGETAATYTATHNGTYTVAITDAHGCHAVSNSITITGVGINDISSDIALKIYPNPSEGIFTLQTTGCEGNYYEITDELGRLVQKKVILSDNTPVDVSTQNGGVFYLTVRNGQQHGTIRFVVLKK
jgi:hypothetical protein